MANNARIAIMRAKIEGVVTDLMLKTTANYVYVDDSTTLAAKLVELTNELAGKATSGQLEQAIAGLGALAKKDKVAYADLETALAALIDGKAEAQALTDEIARAKAAEEANAAAINTAKSELNSAITAESTRATNAEAGLQNQINAITADYLKAADKTELSNAIAAEKERAEAAELSLQNQINTILDNPDAEGAINSINEFTQFVKDHGEVAEGFRQGIADNAAAIALAETKADATTKYNELSELINTKAVQANWNQNDPTAPDYVQGRTHYEAGEQTLIATVPLTTIYSESQGCKFYEYPEDMINELDVSQSYQMRIDGKFYDAVISREQLRAENVLLSDGTNLRTVIFQTYGTKLLSIDGAYDVDISSHTIEVFKGKLEVVQLDEKFIPASIARTSAVDALSGTVSANQQAIGSLQQTVNGLGDLATKDIVTEDVVDSALMEKINASAQGNHSHANKDLLDTYTQTEANLADAVAKKHEHANMAALSDITAAKIASWNGKAKVYGASEEVNLADGEIYIQLLV